MGCVAVVMHHAVIHKVEVQHVKVWEDAAQAAGQQQPDRAHRYTAQRR